MTKFEKQTVINALHFYSEYCCNHSEKSANMIAQKCTAEGLLYMFQSILDENAGSVKI